MARAHSQWTLFSRIYHERAITTRCTMASMNKRDDVDTYSQTSALPLQVHARQGLASTPEAASHGFLLNSGMHAPHVMPVVLCSHTQWPEASTADACPLQNARATSAVSLTAKNRFCADVSIEKSTNRSCRKRAVGADEGFPLHGTVENS